VFVSGSSTEYASGDLEEVNDRGIVLSVETHVGHPAQPLFYPWGAVISSPRSRTGEGGASCPLARRSVKP
jgi:hypothetical protein